MNDEQAVFCYVGLCACGCGAIPAATVDLPQYRKDTADFVADLIRSGMEVKRLPVSETRLSFCECKRPKDQGELALDEPNG